MSQTKLKQPRSSIARDYDRQSEKLSLHSNSKSSAASPEDIEHGRAVEAKFITPLDPVIETRSGDRLPAVPLEEADKINALKDKVDGRKKTRKSLPPRGLSRFQRVNGRTNATQQTPSAEEDISTEKLGSAIPPSRTHPLFPPLPLYGPATTLRKVQCMIFRVTSAFLSTGFLLVIVLGALFTSIGPACTYVWLWLTFRDPDKRRPFYKEELHRAALRREDEQKWWSARGKDTPPDLMHDEIGGTGPYTPLEGGPDPLVCSARYYARRVGLDMEEFKVQTEDGFIISLWHVYDPKEYTRAPSIKRNASSPQIFTRDNAAPSEKEPRQGDASRDKHSTVQNQHTDGDRRYPVLLMHGLLQSAGAYCVNDESSLAFYLAKSGYDVWLGNNRCGFHPEHTLLQYSDPRMWAWNIRQMGVMDLPALISRVLEETGFERLGLVAHSQGTTESFVALAKEQRPDIGDKISIFCALAPAVYAGPLIGKMYFKFMRVISPSMFRVFFGIHSFIPLMMTMHAYLPGKLYGMMGYQVFKFLFNWTDTRWDRGIRDRLFLFSPVYVSSESMRWWLGRECFAKQRCILSTKQEGQIEDEEDEEDDTADEQDNRGVSGHTPDPRSPSKPDHQSRAPVSFPADPADPARVEDAINESHELERIESRTSRKLSRDSREQTAWYPPSCPPMALWVCGSDDLVDGRRLLRRFARGREPNVKVVHTKIIPEYEHLDVLWAMDAVEQVAVEVRECLWRTMNSNEREVCRDIQGVGIRLSTDDDSDSDSDTNCVHDDQVEASQQAPPN